MCEYAPFNSDLISELELKRIIEKFGVKTVVETGTFKGYTTKELSKLVDEVHTVEISDEYFNRAKSYLSDCKNVKIYKGDSSVVLPVLLGNLKSELPIFYLDAHWYNYWPLACELTAISEHFKDNCIIIVDDFQVPGRPELTFDTYQGRPNNLDFIIEGVQKCFDEPFYYYNSKSDMTTNLQATGKIYIFPGKYKEFLKDFVLEENGVYYSNL